MDSTGLQIDLVPGLEREVVDDDLWDSHIKQNKLLKDSDIQPVDEKHIAFLSGLIEECNAKEIFGFHVGHKHFDLLEGTYLAGRPHTYGGRQYYWTRPVDNDGSDPRNLCGRNFVYDRDEGFRPYEFHEGSLPDLSIVDRKLFSKFGSYVAKHKLEHTIALEYLIPELRGRAMVELVLYKQQQILQSEQEIVVPSLGEPVVTAYRHVQSGAAFGPGTRYIHLPDGGHKTYNPDELIGFVDLLNAFRKLNVFRI
ncbi:hypothetical protein BKA60DRAFT_258349 [Fusarium oxysporum]|nr:hypothetical protein BKA60DRAFT_258349 [Fusarium oxysporum]